MSPALDEKTFRVANGSRTQYLGDSTILPTDLYHTDTLSTRTQTT